MLTLPCRQVGGDLRAFCCSCGQMHVHAVDDEDPVPLCTAAGSLGVWLGYQLLVVADAQDDDDLAPLGLDLFLLGRGWRECRDEQTWRHPTLGRRSTAAAAVLQFRLDALHAYQLRRQDPFPC